MMISYLKKSKNPLNTTFFIARNVLQRSDEAISFSPNSLCRNAYSKIKVVPIFLLY